MTRHKHPRKEIEALLAEAEAHGMRVAMSSRSGAFKVRCSCPEGHYMVIHRTPGPTLGRRKANELRKWTCWEEGA